MNVLMFGVAALSLLVWLLSSSLAAEAQAEKRRMVHVDQGIGDRDRTAA